jgi:hypothetical protein
MRIKTKHRNKYVKSSQDGIWVRDFTNTITPCIDINNLITESDFHTILENERTNSYKVAENISNIKNSFSKCIIVSDGYRFTEKQELLSKLPKDVCILGVNEALAKWDLKHKKAMNYLVVNNPYKECLLQIPTKHSYFPKCIASTRTYPDFFKKYKGYTYQYFPGIQENYTGVERSGEYKIDDYRNPICATIHLAYHFGVRKLLLFCCDDSFENSRPGANKLDNNLWNYPQHEFAHNLIDANLYWLKNNQQDRNIEIVDHSSGLKYNNAMYIQEEDINVFFEEAI